MDEKQEKAKKSYLNKMKTVVREHIKEVFTDIFKKGVQNAEDLHGVKINTQQKLDDILKSVYARAKQDSGKLKVFANDVKGVVSEAYKQAVSVALREAEKNQGEGEYSEIDDFDLDMDDFMKEFDIDFDESDLDDDDTEDDEEGNESYVTRLMNMKLKDTSVSNEAYDFVWSLESFDKSTLAGSVILFINKCILYYKSHINEIELSDDELDVLSWIESKISTEEGRTSLINLLSTVDHGINVPDATVQTNEMVNDVLSESIPPAYIKRVGMEDEFIEEKIFDISTADEEVLRELVQLKGVVADILTRFSDDCREDEALNTLTMIHELLVDMSKMYNIQANNGSNNDHIVISTLSHMIKLPWEHIEKVLLIDLSLADEELVDTARQAIVLFSNILNK